MEETWLCTLSRLHGQVVNLEALKCLACVPGKQISREWMGTTFALNIKFLLNRLRYKWGPKCMQGKRKRWHCHFISEFKSEGLRYAGCSWNLCESCSSISFCTNSAISTSWQIVIYFTTGLSYELTGCFNRWHSRSSKTKHWKLNQLRCRAMPSATSSHMLLRHNAK